MKHHNPHTPIMVREALNTQPRVFARYEFGREKVEELGGEFRAFSFVCWKDGVDMVGYCDCGYRVEIQALRKDEERMRSDATRESKMHCG
jgi:hypothetical protein